MLRQAHPSMVYDPNTSSSTAAPSPLVDALMALADSVLALDAKVSRMAEETSTRLIAIEERLVAVEHKAQVDSTSRRGIAVRVAPTPPIAPHSPRYEEYRIPSPENKKMPSSTLTRRGDRRKQSANTAMVYSYSHPNHLGHEAVDYNSNNNHGGEGRHSRQAPPAWNDDGNCDVDVSTSTTEAIEALELKLHRLRAAQKREEEYHRSQQQQRGVNIGGASSTSSISGSSESSSCGTTLTSNNSRNHQHRSRHHYL